jgi:DUF4097 and DUF4098 domain-containing protein YvlB
MLTVPEDTEIDFSTASGNLTLTELKGEFSAETASGDIEVESCSGIFGFSTASGDIDIGNSEGIFEISVASGEIGFEECRGEFELSSASGGIDAYGITIGETSSFSTASGKVDVVLSETSEHNLHLSSASGRVILNYGGNPIKGYFEFTTRDHSGRIRAPFEFDDEEKFRQWGERYIRKSFTRESDSPEIIIETASGRAVLEEG